MTGEVAAAAQQLGCVVTHIGAPELRNLSEAIDIYEVRVDVAAVDTAVDLVCQMRVATADPRTVVLERDGDRRHFCGLPCVSRFAASTDAFLSRSTYA